MKTPLPPGWYPDPDGKAEKLYWDGHQWYTAPPPEEPPSPAPPQHVEAGNRRIAQELEKGMRVRVAAAGDECDGKVGTFHEYLDDDGDGMTIGVLFKGDTHIYAFSPREIQPEIPPPKKKPAAVTAPTPAPTSLIRCFKCNHRQVVAKSTAVWVCEECGQELRRAPSRRNSPPPKAGDAGGAFGSNIGKNAAVAIGVCVLVAIGLLMSMQSVSLMTGTGPIWTGVGFVAAGTAVAFFMRATTWVRVVAAVCLAVVLFNAFYMEQQLSEKRNEISQIFDN